MNGPLAPSAARELIERFAGTTVAVVGDIMLDHFIYGRVNRISPEAPVPVVEFEQDEFRLGGAANVAHNLRALGASVRLVGVVGADDARSRLEAGLQAAGLGLHGLVCDGTRPTTQKVRIVTSRNQQVARIDYERDGEVSGAAEEQLLGALERAVVGARAIVVSDYLKGSITRRVMRRAIDCAAASGTPVLVDPKIPHIDYYAGAYLVTPNHQEAEVATHMRIRTNEDARAAATLLRDRMGCVNILITRGEQGMCLLEGASATACHFPALAREVADVTGAGDTVVATLGLAIAAGASLTSAAQLATHAAGIVVGKFGAAVVTPAELLAAAGG